MYFTGGRIKLSAADSMPFLGPSHALAPTAKPEESMAMVSELIAAGAEMGLHGVIRETSTDPGTWSTRRVTGCSAAHSIIPDAPTLL